jgi:alkylation response protein AidB-like acyl-CoA dehydrogenase
MLTFKEQKLNRHQHVQFELAVRITEVEHAMAFCRRAARQSSPAALQAACRLFAAQTASKLGQSTSRILAAAGLEQATIEGFQRDIDAPALLGAGTGTFEDMDSVVQWALDKD